MLGQSGTLTTITTTPSADRTLTIPDAGTSAASFVMTSTASAQTVAATTNFNSLNYWAATTASTYNTNTAGTGGSSSTTVTGSSTVWTAAMVNGIIVFSTGVHGFITARISNTQILVRTAINVAAGTSYTIYYGAPVLGQDALAAQALYLPATSNQIIFGSSTANIQTLSVATPSASRTVTLPDAGFASPNIVQTDNSFTQISKNAAGSPFSPTLGNGSVSFTMSTNQGWYERVGDGVYYTIIIVWSSKNSVVGNIQIGALPFSTTSTANYRGYAGLGYYNGLTITKQVVFSMANSASSISFLDNAAFVTDTAFSASGEVHVGGFYRTA
jgi:hypothetical protein